jgi:hypothetical protein
VVIDQINIRGIVLLEAENDPLVGVNGGSFEFEAASGVYTELH